MISTTALRSIPQDTWKGLSVLVLVVTVAAMIGVVQAARDRKRRGQSVAGFLAVTRLLAVAWGIALVGMAVAIAKIHGWVA